MSLRSSGEPARFTVQRLESHESWCFMRCIRRDLANCMSSSGLKAYQLLSPLYTQTCMTQLIQSPLLYRHSSYWGHLTLVNIMLEFPPKQVLAYLPPPNIKSAHILSNSSLVLDTRSRHCSRSLAVTSCIYVKKKKKKKKPVNLYIMLPVLESRLLF